MNLIYHFFLQNYARSKIRFMESELGFRRMFVDLGGHKLFYLKRQGEGSEKKTLLLIHGLLDSAAGFRKLAPYLRKDFTILLPDIPGFGWSKLPNVRYLYQVNVFADLLYDSIRELSLENLVLGGHSMGSLIAMHIVLRDAQKEKRIKRLVLLAPGGIPHPKRDEMKDLLFPKNTQQIERLFASLYFSSAPNLGGFAKRALLSTWNGQANSYLTHNTIDREEEIFLGKKLSAIGLKSLIVSGMDDPITDPTMVKKLHSYLKKSKITWVPSAKHALHIEKPLEVGNAINEWL